MKEILNFGLQPWCFADVREKLKEFLELNMHRPVENNKGGMKSTHLFWTWYAVNKIQPDNIIESGVFKGQGTWILRQAAPNAEIFSIDPNLNKRVYIDKEARYFTDDFSIIDWGTYIRGGETLCFFDDHQNAYLRLQQMHWIGFQHAIFEDNYPSIQGDCYSIKKVLSGSGLKKDSTEIVKPNCSHANMLLRRLETYTTFPPLCKLSKTRWGDKWDDENYPTPKAIFDNDEIQEYPLIFDEAGDYTWICYVKLK